MGMFMKLVAVGVVGLALYLGGFLSSDPQPPVLEDGWWGKGPKQADKG